VGIAPQLTGRNFPSRTGLLKWIALAIISFPVPLSPVIRTLLVVAETFRIIPNTASMAPLFAIMFWKSYWASTSCRRFWFSRLTFRCSSIREILAMISENQGLQKIVERAFLRAFTAVSTEA
jgi:hypothetical protein